MFVIVRFPNEELPPLFTAKKVPVLVSVFVKSEKRLFAILIDVLTGQALFNNVIFPLVPEEVLFIKVLLAMEARLQVVVAAPAFTTPKKVPLELLECVIVERRLSLRVTVANTFPATPRL